MYLLTLVLDLQYIKFISFTLLAMKYKPPNNETKSEKFRRIATARTNGILDRLRVLGNCSNQIVYEYKDEEVEKIFATVDEQLRLVKAKFRIGNKHKKFTF